MIDSETYENLSDSDQAQVDDAVEGIIEQNAAAQPTVFLVIAGEAIAYGEDGEIIATNSFLGDGSPDWEYFSVCDHRGGGGARGYSLLGTALRAAETNAKLLGYDPPMRVRT